MKVTKPNLDPGEEMFCTYLVWYLSGSLTILALVGILEWILAG